MESSRSRTDDDRVEKDPNRRVQDAIDLVFNKFAELQTARQVLIWMKQEQVLLPFVIYKSGKRFVESRTPKYRTIYHILTNPIYAAAYLFGRRGTVVKIENGRKRIIHRMRRMLDRVGRFDQGAP